MKPQQVEKYLHTLYTQLAPRLTQRDPAESGFAAALAATAEVDAAAVAQANAVSWHSMLDPKVEEQVFRVGCALTPVLRVALSAAPASTGEAYRVQERLCGLPRAVADRTNVWQSRAMTGVLQVTGLVAVDLGYTALGAELDLAVRRVEDLFSARMNDPEDRLGCNWLENRRSPEGRRVHEVEDRTAHNAEWTVFYRKNRDALAGYSRYVAGPSQGADILAQAVEKMLASGRTPTMGLARLCIRQDFADHIGKTAQRGGFALSLCQGAMDGERESEESDRRMRGESLRESDRIQADTDDRIDGLRTVDMVVGNVERIVEGSVEGAGEGVHRAVAARLGELIGRVLSHEQADEQKMRKLTTHAGLVSALAETALEFGVGSRRAAHRVAGEVLNAIQAARPAV